LLQESGPPKMTVVSKVYPVKPMLLLSSWVTHTCGQGWIYENTKRMLSPH